MADTPPGTCPTNSESCKPQNLKKVAHRTFAQLLADKTAAFTGSWSFIIVYVLLTILWCGGNESWWSFDRYPYPFYTFGVSVLAILMSSLILLAGNRQSEIDRSNAENSYRHIDEVNAKQDEQMKILEFQNGVLKEQNDALKAQNLTVTEQHAQLLERFGSLEKLLREHLGVPLPPADDKSNTTAKSDAVAGAATTPETPAV